MNANKDSDDNSDNHNNHICSHSDVYPFSLDREHEREMNRISQEMNELHEKIDRALGRP